MDEILGVPHGEKVDFGKAIGRGIEKGADRVRHPRKYLYPNAPEGEDVVPLGRPPEADTGHRNHPGYRTINVTHSSSNSSSGSIESLQIFLDRLMPHVLNFEHESGEFFILKAYADIPDEDMDLDDPLHIMSCKGEFRLGEDGEVKEFGAAIEEEMGEDRIWFRKVGSGWRACGAGDGRAKFFGRC